MKLLRIVALCSVLVMPQAVKVKQLTPEAITAFLAEHNAARAKISVPLLQWDTALSKSSESWGKQCKWEHSKNRSRIGENLYTTGPKIYSGKELAKKSLKVWTAEIEFKDEDWACILRKQNTCGHYTQVVWKDSKKVGCAVVYCDNKLKNLVVCHYSPGLNPLHTFSHTLCHGISCVAGSIVAKVAT